MADGGESLGPYGGGGALERRCPLSPRSRGWSLENPAAAAHFAPRRGEGCGTAVGAAVTGGEGPLVTRKLWAGGAPFGERRFFRTFSALLRCSLEPPVLPTPKQRIPPPSGGIRPWLKRMPSLSIPPRCASASRAVGFQRVSDPLAGVLRGAEPPERYPSGAPSCRPQKQRIPPPSGGIRPWLKRMPSLSITPRCASASRAVGFQRVSDPLAGVLRGAEPPERYPSGAPSCRPQKQRIPPPSGGIRPGLKRTPSLSITPRCASASRAVGFQRVSDPLAGVLRGQSPLSVTPPPAVRRRGGRRRRGARGRGGVRGCRLRRGR